MGPAAADKQRNASGPPPLHDAPPLGMALKGLSQVYSKMGAAAADKQRGVSGL